ncbi:MAG: MFS transporter [Fuerstiella sp.]|nr:MFS transporter [Fuerstiella sp.]
MPNSRLKQLLYLICLLTDFCAFVVIFAVTRRLAEQQADLWYLGMFGAAFSFSAGLTSVLSGWLSSRFDSRFVFVSGCITVALGVMACAFGDTTHAGFLLRYCLLGIGLGFIYPTLIGWLNRNEDVRTNRRGVSRTLILYCVAWNVGMMCGQLTAGWLFAQGLAWLYGLAFGASIANVCLAIAASRLVAAPSVTSVTGNEDTTEVSDRFAGSDPVNTKVAVHFKRLGWIANSGGTFGTGLVLHLLPDLVVTIGIPADSHGSLLAYGRGVVIATYLLMHVNSFWHYRFSVSLVSQVLGAIGLIMFACADSAVTLIVGLTLHSQLAGYNYFSGLFYSTVGSSPESRTLAAGIHEATLAAGMAAGTAAAGVLGTFIGNRAPYVLSFIVLAVLIVVQIAVFCRWFLFMQKDSTGSAAKFLGSMCPDEASTARPEMSNTNHPPQSVALPQNRNQDRSQS